MANVKVIFTGVWLLWLGPSLASVEADNLGEAMAIVNMKIKHALIKKLKIMHSSSKGKIENYSYILVNDTVPRKGLKTKLEAGDTIKLIPKIVGG